MKKEKEKEINEKVRKLKRNNAIIMKKIEKKGKKI